MKKILLYITTLFIGSLNAQIELGMIAHFPFNNNLTDLSSSSITATNNGCVFGLDRNTITASAITLNGLSNDVSFDDNNVKVALPITISAWVNINSMTTPNIIFTSDNVFGNWHGYAMNIVGTGQVILSIHGGLGNQGNTNRRSFMANQTLQLGTWYHVVGIIRDYDDMSIYIDCIDAAGTYSGTGATSIVYSTNNSRIGSGIGGASYPEYFYDGSIDQLVIWNREITPSEITYMCDINNTLKIDELGSSKRTLVKIIDLMGRTIEPVKNTPLIYVYSDGSTERVFEMD